MERRRKVSPAEATSRASEIIPDESGIAPPPPREEASTRVNTTETRAPSSARGPWGTIIDSVISVDPEVAFARLTRELSLNSDHTSYAHVAQALDLADRRHFEAVTLMRSAKLEEQRIDRETEMRLEVLRSSARREVEEEKRKAAEAAKSKSMGKATLEEVRDRCYASWPDEMSSIERRREEYHAARALTEELAVSWRSRAASLRELIAGLRGR